MKLIYSTTFKTTDKIYLYLGYVFVFDRYIQTANSVIKFIYSIRFLLV